MSIASEGQSVDVVYINIPNLCDNFIKKVVSEIRKCRQLQGEPLPGALPLNPIGGSAPKPPLCNLAPPS